MKEHDIVRLKENFLNLKKGQIGTIIASKDNLDTILVEFSDACGINIYEGEIKKILLDLLNVEICKKYTLDELNSKLSKGINLSKSYDNNSKLLSLLIYRSDVFNYLKKRGNKNFNVDIKTLIINKGLKHCKEQKLAFRSLEELISYLNKNNIIKKEEWIIYKKIKKLNKEKDKK